MTNYKARALELATEAFTGRNTHAFERLSTAADFAGFDLDLNDLAEIQTHETLLDDLAFGLECSEHTIDELIEKYGSSLDDEESDRQSHH
jgi:hypothetical protein